MCTSTRVHEWLAVAIEVVDGLWLLAELSSL